MWVGWSTRRTPPAAQAASTTCEGLVIEPVCDTALRTAASDRPGESSTTGFPAPTRARAADTKARPSTTSSA